MLNLKAATRSAGHAQLGEHQDALSCCRRALTALRGLDDPYGQAATWDSLGFVHHRLLDHEEAVACYERALCLRRELGDRAGEAMVLAHLGNAHWAAGAPGAARDAWQRALTILDQLGSPAAERLRGDVRLLTTEEPTRGSARPAVPRRRCVVPTGVGGGDSADG